MNEMVAKSGLIKQLVEDEFEYIFGNPGSTESGFLDALSEQARPKYILGLHETVVMGMADAYSRATKKTVIVQLHAVAGLGNGMGMLYQAYRGKVPLVVLAGSAGIKYSSMDGLLAANMLSFVQSITKWSAKVTSSDSILRILRRAVKVAGTPPTGPVFIDLPMDIMEEILVEEIIKTSPLDTRTFPQEESLHKATDMLLGANRPFMVIGDEIAQSGAESETAEVARIIGAEVWGANCHELIMSHRNPQFRGVLGFNNGNDAKKIIAPADVLLIIGTSMTPQLFPYTGNINPPGCKVIHISSDPTEVGRDYPVDLGLVSDIKLTLDKLSTILAQKITTKQKQATLERINAISEKKEADYINEINDDNTKSTATSMHPSIFMKQFAELIPEDTVIFDEAITTSGILTRYVRPHKPGHYFLLRGGVLGAGIPGAIGLKLAYPDKTVIGFVGDGASQFSIHGLWTAAHYKIGAKFVICDNQSYRILKINMMKYWNSQGLPSHNFPKSFDINSPGIDFVKLSDSFGVPAIRVDKESAVKPAIEKMLATEGPFLIDLILSGTFKNYHPVELCTCGQ